MWPEKLIVLEFIFYQLWLTMSFRHFQTFKSVGFSFCFFSPYFTLVSCVMLLNMSKVSSMPSFENVDCRNCDHYTAAIIIRPPAFSNCSLRLTFTEVKQLAPEPA